mmetsp:Transcript_41611/g.126183  ORF Transcript_41611/g.126183 Transcript_41611/m.126183 type:complete len:247 (-) Transcript_41611:560-1300(-)
MTLGLGRDVFDEEPRGGILQRRFDGGVGGVRTQVRREGFGPQGRTDALPLLLLFFSLSLSLPYVSLLRFGGQRRVPPQSVRAAPDSNPIIAGIRRNEHLFESQIAAQFTVQYRIEGDSARDAQILFPRFGFEMSDEIQYDILQIGLDPVREGDGVQRHLGRKADVLDRGVDHPGRRRRRLVGAAPVLGLFLRRGDKVVPVAVVEIVPPSHVPLSVEQIRIRPGDMRQSLHGADVAPESALLPLVDV